MFNILYICDALCDLVPYVQFKKREETSQSVSVFLSIYIVILKTWKTIENILISAKNRNFPNLWNSLKVKQNL